MSQRNLLFISLVIAVVIVLSAVAYLIYQTQIRSKSTKNTSPFISQTETDYIKVGDQAVGPILTVNEILLSEPGFVFLLKTDQTGEPTKIIGASRYLHAGVKKTLQIRVNPSETLTKGEIIFVRLMKDDGDGVIKRPNTDEPVRDKSGNIIQESFTLK